MVFRGARPAPKGPWPHHSLPLRLSPQLVPVTGSQSFGRQCAQQPGVHQLWLSAAAHSLAAHFPAQNLILSPESRAQFYQVHDCYPVQKDGALPKDGEAEGFEEVGHLKLLSVLRNCAASVAAAAGWRDGQQHFSPTLRTAAAAAAAVPSCTHY